MLVASVTKLFTTFNVAWVLLSDETEAAFN